MSSEHPALKNFSSTWEGIKHVGGKILKWGALAAVAFAAGPALLGMIGGAILPFAKALSGAQFLGLPALQAGAVVGGLFGAITGISSVGKAVAESRDDAIADYEQNMLARERAVLLSRGRGQSFANSEAAIGNVAYRAPGKNQGMSVG